MSEPDAIDAAKVRRKRKRRHLAAEEAYRTGNLRFFHGVVNGSLRLAANRDGERLLAEIPTDTRDLTARLLGDPLPGRSALAQRQAKQQWWSR